jgi:hypothetical protein
VPPRDRPAAASSVAGNLRRISRRLCAVEWMRIASAAIVVGAILFAALTWSGVTSRASASIAIGLAAVAVAWRAAVRRSQWSPAAAAKAIERAAPASRNVVVTAEELLRHPERARHDTQDRVFEHAVRVSEQTPASATVPLNRSMLVAAASVVVAAAIVLGMPSRAATSLLTSLGSRATGADVAPLTIAATIIPPSYTGEAPRSIENPERIEALEGSLVRLSLRGSQGWRVRFGSRPLELRTDGQVAIVELPLTQSGYLAIESEAPAGRDQRPLLPVVVNPDRAPTIRIDAPGKDLLLPNAKPIVSVAASASDDYGLASLDLRYTRISGSGEQFEFQEGTIPLRIARGNDRSWKADAELAIARLGLTPGDSLVYRVVGRDRRPGDAGLASSDTFFVEVAGPGQVALEGFELPPDRERYALSQQMIVLKLERLRARERTIDRATLEQEVANLAAEQRAVRANFIFLTGGTVEDEEEEAEHSHEIQEGRLVNTARREIGLAIQHMSHAEQGLAAVNTGAALPPARAAVEALQRAFGRNRYFLRTVPVRSRVDPSRRLSGNLTEAAAWRRELFPPSADDAADRARAVLARLIELSPRILNRELPPAAMTAIAEEAIAIDPASSEWQAVAKGLIDMRDGRDGAPADRAKRLDRTVGTIAGVVRKHASAATRQESAADPLRSAWQDARERK